MPELLVTQVKEGLQFGHGSISAENVDAESRSIVENIVHTDPNIIVEVDRLPDGSPVQDDGCGDGRGVKTIYTKFKKFAKSLHRPKILGGGGAMTVAARIATGDADGKSLNADFSDAAEILVERGIDFGAHTAEHATGEKSGCGAIDEAPEVVAAAITYKQPISEVMSALGAQEHVIGDAYAAYEEYSANLPQETGFSGKKVVDTVVDHGKVVKELKGDHREVRIVLNKVRGYTVNQELVRDGTDEKAQVFGVDVWRLEDLANNLYDQDPEKAESAFAGELIYTLATTGVLTKGDLPVDIIEEQDEQIVPLAA